MESLFPEKQVPASPGTDKALASGRTEVVGLAEELKRQFALSDEEPGHDGGAGPFAAKSEKVSDGAARIYTADEIKELVSLPAETMYALTNNERWLLDKKELDIVSEKVAKALSLIMKIEPKWFVVGSAVIALGAMYGPRAIAEFQDKRGKKTANEKAA